MLKERAKFQMSYYHVLIINPSEYVEYDIENFDILISDVIVPYFKKQPFILGGRRFDFFPSSCQLKVIRTEKKKNEIMSEIAEIEKQQSKGINNINRINIFEMTQSEFLIIEDITRKAITEANEKIKIEEIQCMVGKQNKPKNIVFSNRKIFIVHGRDVLLRTQLESILRALGLEPVILQEQSNNGNTIIEKIEECTDVGFGIVLYTPCDEGRLKSEKGELRSRARQNVVLEHGYLMAKLGRKRVCCLVSDDVEFPSDIQGIGYISAKDFDQWKYKVAKELQGAGFNIDMNKF